MRHSSLRPLIAETDAQARAFSTIPEARLAIFETALACLRRAFEDEEQPRAWERVAHLLADLRASAPIDALDASPLDRARRRLALLTELPEATGFASLQEVVDLISDAINRGAPRYNSGDVRGCAALYWTTIRVICETPATRGVPGYARLQGQLRTFAETVSFADTMSPAETDAWAWELRHALDSVARSVSQPTS
ncbi:MAG TPA: hypothetical protein VF808_04645 [Ktedonobacterales bacterium]